ncbi:hypothetical protein [Acidipila sp. EB88]|uniref:hypothetical protein n=1 Tax=Acidipila sp. EB88 TaxID=2305226 RepID=UPI000F5D6C1E|nr:hypothetical protein [Acidipila sp. EB88]
MNESPAQYEEVAIQTTHTGAHHKTTVNRYVADCDDMHLLRAGDTVHWRAFPEGSSAHSHKFSVHFKDGGPFEGDSCLNGDPHDDGHGGYIGVVRRDADPGLGKVKAFTYTITCEGKQSKPPQEFQMHTGGCTNCP